MRAKMNKKVYDVLKFTNDKHAIEDFAGKESIAETRIYGMGFTASYEHAISGAKDIFWLTPETVAIKNNQGEIFYIPNSTFNELFKEVK